MADMTDISCNALFLSAGSDPGGTVNSSGLGQVEKNGNPIGNLRGEHRDELARFVDTPVPSA